MIVAVANYPQSPTPYCNHGSNLWITAWEQPMDYCAAIAVASSRSWIAQDERQSPSKHLPLSRSPTHPAPLTLSLRRLSLLKAVRLRCFFAGTLVAKLALISVAAPILLEGMKVTRLAMRWVMLLSSRRGKRSWHWDRRKWVEPWRSCVGGPRDSRSEQLPHYQHGSLILIQNSWQ